MDAAFNLMTELSLDPFHRHAFWRDPEQVARDAGLSSEALARLRCGGPEVQAPGRFVPSLALFDPGPDPLPDPDVPD